MLRVWFLYVREISEKKWAVLCMQSAGEREGPWPFLCCWTQFRACSGKRNKSSMLQLSAIVMLLATLLGHSKDDILLRKLVALLFLCCSGLLVHAEANLQIPRTKTPPVLSDYVDTIPSDAGVAVTNFLQRSPGDGTPATKSTTAYLSFDDSHFYAVFVAKDDPQLVRARVAKRENFEGDDFVILELDTFHDQRRSFTFYVNPYGVQFDAKRTEGMELDLSFETQWQSDGQLTANGYVAMIAIPFKSLRFKSADVQTWGITVGRVIARLNEESYWPIITKKIAGVVPQMASVTIPEKLTAGRNIQISPFVFLGKSRILNTENAHQAFWKTENKLQGGLDAKWVLGDATAFDLTLKPDFSEVDSDEPQIIIDKRYEVLFPEKRPFFLENAGFFQTPNPLFFSRRIHEPTAGLRMTGREGAWSFGGLMIDDQAPNSGSSGSSGSEDAALAGKAAHIVTGRVQNDLNKEVSLGVLFTDRRIDANRNTVFGFDGRYQLDENWTVAAQLASSQTRESKGAIGGIGSVSRQQQGQLGFLEVKHEGKHLEYESTYLEVTPHFDTSLAFLPRTDVRQLQQHAKYEWQLEDQPWLQTVGLIGNAIATRDQQNRPQDWVANAGFLTVASRSSWLVMLAEKSFEHYEGRDYRKHAFIMSTGTNWWDSVGFMMDAVVGENINYSPAKTTSAFLGNSRSLNFTLTFKPHPQWHIEEKLLWNDLQTQNTSPSGASGVSVYRDSLFRSKISYQYDRFWGARLILDYHNLSANPLLSSLKSGKQLNTDFQISYVLSPGTTFYTGYGNRQENLALIGNPQRVQSTENLSLRTGARVFVKLNYLMQL